MDKGWGDIEGVGLCLLGHGRGWHILACKSLMPWAEKLAAVMRLRNSEPNGSPKLIFVPKQFVIDYWRETTLRTRQDILRELPGDGWEPLDMGSVRFWSRPDVNDVLCEIDRGDKTLDFIMMRQSLYPIYQQAQESGGLPLHAGLVGRDGQGFLLAAPHDTGKSTCCLRIPTPWYALCDEEALVIRDDQQQYLVHPFPTWSDYLTERSEGTWDVQHHLPLAAIFFLEQAETDDVEPVGEGLAAALISRSAAEVRRRTWLHLDNETARALRKKLFDNACQLARSVPTFALRVSRQGRFWEEMERVLPL